MTFSPEIKFKDFRGHVTKLFIKSQKRNYLYMQFSKHVSNTITKFLANFYVNQMIGMLLRFTTFRLVPARAF